MACSPRGWSVSAIALVLAACGGSDAATGPGIMDLTGTWSGATPVHEVMMTLTTVWEVLPCSGGLFVVCKSAPAASIEGTLRNRTTGETIALSTANHFNFLPPRDSAVSLALRDELFLPDGSRAEYHFHGRLVGEATLAGWLVYSTRKSPEPVVVDSMALTLRRQ